MRRFSAVLLFLWLCVATVSVSADATPDEPLSLSSALALADNTHPSTRSAELELEAAIISSEFLASSNQLSVEATIFPRQVDRAAAGMDSSLNDSYATVRLTHPLYDFGRKGAAINVANTEFERARHDLDYARAQRRIEIMRRFFDVLTADLAYGVQDEKMTLSFLRYNRFLEEREMHDTHAEVDVLALETVYREEFKKRQEASVNRQRARRNLGMILGFGDYVPRDLEMPDLSAYVEREVPEFEVLLEQIRQHNHDMKQAETNLRKAVMAAELAALKYKPQLDAILEATAWDEKTGSRNAASVGIRFHWPLAAVKQRERDRRLGQVAIDRAQANLTEIEQAVQMRAFDLWKSLTLHHLDLQSAETRIEYRDQYMDRARTLYELEERADLGDAQAELLRALLEDYQVKFNLAVTWSEIDALTGQAVHPH